MTDSTGGEPPRSEGQCRLRELAKTHSLSEIGVRCGKSKQAVHRWIRGGKEPDRDSRRALEDGFGLPAMAWELAPGAPVPEASGMASEPVHKASEIVTPAVTPSTQSVTPSTQSVTPSQVDEPVPEPSVPPATALAALREHVLECTARRRRAEDGGASGPALEKLVALERQAIVAWGRATGEMSPGDEARLTTSSRYLRIQTAIVQALVAFPEASEAVLRALAEVEPEAARAVEQANE